MATEVWVTGVGLESWKPLVRTRTLAADLRWSLPAEQP